jgi:serine/threonine protein kinase
MEWCDGGTFTKQFYKPRHDSQHDFMEVCEAICDIARGGAYLHKRGIVHGDLSGNNVMLKSQNTRKGYICKVCDFGVSRVLGDDAMVQTKTIGSIMYMPPERYDIEKPELSAKTDVWSVGVLLWQGLMGQLPYQGLNPPQIVIRVMKGLRLTLPCDCDDFAKNLLEQCIGTDPGTRPTMASIVQALTDKAKEFEPGLDAKTKTDNTDSFWRESATA